LACDKLKEAVVADELLFTTIGIFYPSLDVKYLQIWFIARIKIVYLNWFIFELAQKLKCDIGKLICLGNHGGRGLHEYILTGKP
jgi:hypothetical protein